MEVRRLLRKSVMQKETTTPIGAYRPTYGAFFIEDKFQLKDLTFRLGLRIDRYDLNQAVLRDPLIVEGFQSVGDVNYLYNVSNYANAADVPESGAYIHYSPWKHRF